MIVEKMGRELGLPNAFITSLARTASHEYKEYKIQKRTGGFRLIHHPAKRLKALQRWLLTHVVQWLPVHSAAMAYRLGTSIFDNARVHAGSRYLLRMDLTDFFPSIKQVDIEKYVARNTTLFSKWSDSDIKIFCKLVCRNGALTIGAPTSPALSNVVCFEMDTSLEAMCTMSRVTYTRYADDLFFSTENPNVLQGIENTVMKIISDLEIPSGLKINRKKTRHSSKRGARRVTGIVIGSDGQAHISRRYKRKIRALIHKFNTLNSSTRASLSGMISYVSGFDPQFENSLITKYGLRTVKRAMAGV